MDQHRLSRRTLLQGTSAAAGAFWLAHVAGLAQATPGASPVAGNEPLSIWNDGPVRTALIDFVTRTTTEGSPDYLDPIDRIAVFHNDGTHWC